jgi:hypothetical protein
VVNLNPDQFQNPKPYFTKGGQGKFFPDPKPIPEHRWPRGYSPERMREVEGGRDAPPGLSIQSAVTKRSKAAFAGPAGVARVKQVIARSTTPAEELRPTGPGQRLSITTGSPKTGANAWASYTHKPALGRRPGEIHLGKEQDENMMGQALMHEMGHFRSHMEGTPHFTSRAPSDFGKEEAFADENMLQRWRPDPRDVRKGKDERMSLAYERRSSFGRTASGGAAFRAYSKSRTSPSRKEVEDRQQAAQNVDASHQPQMLGDVGGGRRTKPTGHRVESWAQPEGPLHPMQFGRLT